MSVTASSSSYDAAGKDMNKEARLRRRREQNRQAAQRSREREKNLTVQYLKECQTLNSYNTELRRQIRELRQKRQQLVDLLDAHLAQHPGCPASVDPLLPSSSWPQTDALEPTTMSSTSVSSTVDKHMQLDVLTQFLV